MTDTTTPRPITGWHVLAVFVLAFGIIIAVNMTLAMSAVRTFPGLETKNSYVASQKFEADRTAQEALGWQVVARVSGDEVILQLDTETGPAQPEITRATLGRATHVHADRDLDFRFDGLAHRAQAPDLAPGNWNLRLEAVARDGTPFRQRIVIRVPG